MAAEAGSIAEPDSARRELDIDGETWVAEISGRCTVGGWLGPVTVESIRFRQGEGEGASVRFAYLTRGRFHRLREDELQRLHRVARPLEPRSPHGRTAKR